jgi:hypothetical protein
MPTSLSQHTGQQQDRQMLNNAIAHACRSVLGRWLLAGSVPALNELGDDDIVHIDMKELVGRDMILKTPREAVQDTYDEWYRMARDSLGRKIATGTYKEQLNSLKLTPSSKGIVGDMNTCLTVVVLARLLYKMKLRVLPAEIPEADENLFL